jgi:hypothetical protein
MPRQVSIAFQEAVLRVSRKELMSDFGYGSLAIAFFCVHAVDVTAFGLAQVVYSLVYAAVLYRAVKKNWSPEEEMDVLVSTDLQSSSTTTRFVTHSLAVASSANQSLQSRYAVMARYPEGRCLRRTHQSVCRCRTCREYIRIRSHVAAPEEEMDVLVSTGLQSWSSASTRFVTHSVGWLRRQASRCNPGMVDDFLSS